MFICGQFLPSVLPENTTYEISTLVQDTNPA